VAVSGKISMPENVQNRQVQSSMVVIMSSEGPGFRAVHPDPRAPPSIPGRTALTPGPSPTLEPPVFQQRKYSV